MTCYTAARLEPEVGGAMLEWIVYIPGEAIGMGPIYAVCAWVANTSQDRTDFKQSMNEVRRDIKLILGRLPSGAVKGAGPGSLGRSRGNASRGVGRPHVGRQLPTGTAAEVQGFEKVRDLRPLR